MSTQNITKYLGSAFLCTILAGGFMVAAFDASAAEIRVKCEARDGDRSKASIDGNDLVAGEQYTIMLSSDGGPATVVRTADAAGEVDADWDSNTEEDDDRIAADFIGATATGTIVGAGVNLSETVNCRQR